MCCGASSPISTQQEVSICSPVFVPTSIETMPLNGKYIRSIAARGLVEHVATSQLDLSEMRPQRRHIVCR
jgi:hypothetical protein